jgi:hypothetical protein
VLVHFDDDAKGLAPHDAERLQDLPGVVPVSGSGGAPAGRPAPVAPSPGRPR